MSNLSDLLPAGASAKQITATDSGSGIASKAPVILNSDGTVTEVSSSTATANVGSITTFNSDAATWCATAAGSGSTNLVAYVDSGASSYGTAQVGTISGTGVTFGTKAVFESASVTGIKMAYSSSLDKYLIVYRDNGGSYYGTAVVATVSGTSVTFGTPVVFSARTTYGYGVVYDDTASAFVVQYTNDATVYVRACSVSGTVPTFGGEVTVESSTSYSNSAIGYDSVAGKPVGAWRNYTSQQGKAVVYSLSGTTVTANTPVVFASGSTFSGADASISYNVKENRMVIGYKEGAGTSGTAIAGEVSGTSITFGSAVQFNASSSGSITCDYDATVARTIIGYLDAGAAEYPKAIPVTLSGSTITFPDSATTLQSAAAMNLSASYNGTEGKMLFSWIDTSPTQGDSAVFTSPGTVENLTAQAFVGVADSAISASAAGSIIVQGGTVTGLSSLTTGSKYYVQTDGSILASAQNAAYDIASASYSNKSFSVASQESNPKGIAFNTTGTRMYIVGSVNNTVYEYNLSTAFDVSTTVYSQSFSLVANVSSASDIVFNNDGTKMFVLDRSGSAVDQYALSSGFDVSTSSYTQSFSVSTQENQAEGLRFNTDGTRMFVVGENGDDVNEYALSTGFDVSTASFTDSFSVASQETDPKTLAFNADGTKMFVLGAINDSIFEYTLTTGFDVSTASYSSTSFSVNSQDPNASGMAFSEDGTKFYVMGSNDTVYQYATSLGAFSTTVNAGLAISTTSLLLNGDS